MSAMFTMRSVEPSQDALLRIQCFEERARTPAFHPLAFNGPASHPALSHLSHRVLMGAAKTAWAAQSWWCRKECASRYFVPKCEIRPSAIHGQGVFATCLIGKGEVITVYPSDGFLWWPSMQTPTCWGVAGDDVYKFDVSGWPEENGVVAIFGDPKKVDDPFYLGHMINDRWVCTGSTAKEINLYEALTVRSSNAWFWGSDNHYVYVIAQREIMQDEEIFVHYGAMYWIKHPPVKTLPATSPKKSSLDELD